MLNALNYIYDLNSHGEQSLLGARVIFSDGTKIQSKEILVGLRFGIQDITDNKVNADALNIRDIAKFEEMCKRFNAVGIVYFPQIDDYAYLHEGDVVIQWISNESVAELIEQELEVYANLPVEGTYQPQKLIRTSQQSNR